MRPYLKNVNTLIVDKNFPFEIQFDGAVYYVFDIRDSQKIRFYHFENAIFCVLTMFYDTLTNSFDELPLVDIFGDYDLLCNKVLILSGYKDSDEDNKYEK